MVGLLVGSFYAWGVVITRSIGFSLPDATLFMAMLVLGGFSFQWPIRMLADRNGRRLSPLWRPGLGGRLPALAGEPDRVQLRAADPPVLHELLIAAFVTVTDHL